MSIIHSIKKDNLSDENVAYKYYIESIEQGDVDYVIKGWVYSTSGRIVNVDLRDERKESIKECEIWRKTRKDVKEHFKLKDDFKAEFLIRFDRQPYDNKSVFICFFSAEEKDMLLEINMSSLDFSFTMMGRVVEFMSDKPIRRMAKFITRADGQNLHDKIEFELKGQKDAYTIWREENMTSDEEYERQRQKKFEYEPLISIAIPLYNTPLNFFRPLMESILGQTYRNFELCLADGSNNDNIKKYIDEKYGDDSRIKYMYLDENQGIAGNTNKALGMTTGEFVMLTDHDDVLDIGALHEIVKTLNESPDTDIIYTDEDLVDASGRVYSDYRFKPDFNLEMLRHINYICHIFVVRKEIMNKVGGFREEFDGAQDYDMILRCCEESNKIKHIPKVLYHWRAHEDSTAGNQDSKSYAVNASVRALQQHYKRVGIDAEVESTDVFIMLKTNRKLKEEPLVSILIPSKDHIDDLDKCIKSVVNSTSYTNYEIIIIENNSTEEDTFDYYDEITGKYNNIKVVKWEEGFNYSKINNFGAQFAKGKYYILLNNDIEVISSDWIDRMVGYIQDDDVGAVGAKLLYSDDTVQHCGVVIGVGGFAGHILTGETLDDVGYFGRLRVQQEVSAVTAACMMVDADVFREVGGFDEEFTVALNDVDLCLKIRALEKKIILDPNILMHHYESKSRGYEETEEKVRRFKREIKRFRDKWGEMIENGDPYYSPNLTHDRGDCSPRREDERFIIVEEIERGEM